MTKKKKIIISAVSVILVIAIAVGVSLGLLNKAKTPDIQNSYDEIYTQENVSFDVSQDGEFSILKINDTHLINGTCKNDVNTLSDLKSILDKTPCDLIIVNGDLVDGYNAKITYNKYKATAAFCELLESYDTPWTFAPGNNDGQQDGSNEDLIAYMMQYPNFICGNEEGIDGSMQFFIDLTQNGSTVHSIAVMDSLSLNNSGSYDYIKESQINWLLDEIDARKVKTSVFFHMPTPAFKTAYENGVPYENFPFSDEYAVDDIKENQLFDSMTQDNEYITLISTAHVHSDNIAYYYNNRYYQLSSLGGYNAAGSNNTKPSCTLTTINVNETDTQKMYTFEKISAE